MVQYAIVVDLGRFVGCDGCIVACKQENDVRLGSYWMWVYQVGPTGNFPDVSMHWLPRPCMHCKNPPCLNVCPTKAIYKRADGIVLIDHEKCIGCRYCVWACPYGSMQFNPDTGIVEKCILCSQRIDKGEKPACVDSCPGRALTFGDIDDPASEASKLIGTKQGFVLLPDIGAEPAVHYLPPGRKL